MRKLFLLSLSICSVALYGQKISREEVNAKYTTVFWMDKKFDGGYCRVKKNNKWGVINADNVEVIPCNYDDICHWQLQFAPYCMIKQNSKCGVYDISQNKEIVPCQFGYIRGFPFRRLPYAEIAIYDEDEEEPKPQNRVGIIDMHGKVLLPCEYTDIMMFKNVAIVAKGGQHHPYNATNAKYALYNLEERKFVTGFDYGYIELVDYAPEEGLLCFNKGGVVTSYIDEDTPKINGGKWGYLDVNGKEQIPALYDVAKNFSDGTAMVQKGGVSSMIVNPIKGTKMQLSNGKNSVVDYNIPQTKKHDENMFAFIFATENYVHLTGADYAANDGKVFAEYCKKTIGIPEKNIRYYEDATYGNIVGALKKMSDIADVYDGEAKLLIYYAGLGATDSKTKEPYLLASDASVETMTSTGFSIRELQKLLNEMKTAYTLAVIDAPFSNMDRNGKPLSSTRGVQIVPKKVLPTGNLVLYMGCEGNETAYACKDYEHGLLTYALLMQLQATKGEGSLKDLTTKSTEWVGKESLKQFDKKQVPSLLLPQEFEKEWSNLKF